MAKPTVDPKWVSTDDPNNIVEPSPSLKLNGVEIGGTWARQYLNWMFNAISKWIDWVREDALDRTQNLNDVANKVSSFDNIKQNATQSKTGVVEKATQTETLNGTADKYPDAAAIKVERDKLLRKDDNLASVGSAATSFNNIKQSATTTSTGVVEKATTSEMNAGTADKYPDASAVHGFAVSKNDFHAFKVNSNGSLVGAPAGWSGSLSGNTYTITHNSGTADVRPVGKFFNSPVDAHINSIGVNSFSYVAFISFNGNPATAEHTLLVANISKL